MSLNGKIAKLDGSVDWLDSIPPPENGDYGYADFYSSIDTTIQGKKTYDQVIGWDMEFPYPDKKNYVLTRQKGLDNTEYVEFVSENHMGFIENLKKQEGRDIWLIGGGVINTLLLNAKLLDELFVFVMPIILDDGIDLFGSLPNETLLKLIESQSYSTGAVELKYEIS